MKRISGIGLVKFQKKVKEKAELENTPENLEVLSDAVFDIADETFTTEERLEILSDAFFELADDYLNLMEEFEKLKEEQNA